MPNPNGVYVNPGWVNNAQPNINATELNAISDTLERVPVANGGTGATTAAQALENLGGLAKSSVTNKGDNTAPVYFNASGVAVPIETVSRSWYSPSSGDTVSLVAYKYGKVVTLTGYTTDKSSVWSMQQILDAGFKPRQQYYGFAYGTDQSSAGSAPTAWGIVSINTSGSIRVEVMNSSSEYYLKFSATYISD